MTVARRSPSPLVLRGGHVHTMGEPPYATALAVTDGRILAVGSDVDVWSAVGSDAPEVDLEGRTVLPGFVDAHLHWTAYALSQSQASIDPGASLRAVVESVRQFADPLQPGAWLLGRGWDHSSWGRWPVAQDLDRLIGDRPVALIRKDGHALWLNSVALQAAGIGPATPDPEGGEIARHQGRPSGVLKENAMRLAFDVIPAPGASERQQAIAAAWPSAWRRGITGCHDMGASQLRQDLTALRETGDLGLRFVCYIARDRLDEAIAEGQHSGTGDDWLSIGGLKLFLDGTLGSRTAAMLEPYEGTDCERGILVLEPEQLACLVSKAADAGLATAVHAIGDAANRYALDAFASVAGRRPTDGRLRHRIEHAQVLNPVDAPRFARLGVTASMQPLHATVDRPVADSYWGPRAAHAYSWRTLLDCRALIVFGSDAPVETLDPFAGLHAAVTRQGTDGQPPGGWHPEQCLSIDEAIAAYTIAPARAVGRGRQLGCLSAGKLADLIVLDRSPFGPDPGELLATQVEATMIGGRWVWQAPGASLGRSAPAA